MAHGQDVANLGRVPGVTAATKRVVGRAAAVIANSSWLADRLCERIPAAREKLSIADCGVDLDAFAPRDAAEARARARLGRGRGPRVPLRRLADRAQERDPPRRRLRAPRGRAASPSSATARCASSSRAGANVTRTGRQSRSPRCPRWVAACDVLCQPSLIEPFGQATLEAMAMERSVVATTVGGPARVRHAPRPGVLVDPEDDDGPARRAARRRRAPLAQPGRPRRRRRARRHDDGGADGRGPRARGRQPARASGPDDRAGLGGHGADPRGIRVVACAAARERVGLVPAATTQQKPQPMLKTSCISSSPTPPRSRDQLEDRRHRERVGRSRSRPRSRAGAGCRGRRRSGGRGRGRRRRSGSAPSPALT